MPPQNQQPPVAPQYSAPTNYAPAENPGKTLGIVSLILSLVGFGLFGLIAGIIGMKKSKQAGMSNGLALAGIIIGAINMVVVTIIAVIAIIGGSSIVSKCQDLGPGTHEVDGVTYTCS